MSKDHLHRPLSPNAERWLIYFCDPCGHVALPSGILTAAELNSIIAAAALHGVLPTCVRAAEGCGLRGAGIESAPGLGNGRDDWNKVLETARLQITYQAGLGLMLAHHAARVSVRN